MRARVQALSCEEERAEVSRAGAPAGRLSNGCAKPVEILWITTELHGLTGRKAHGTFERFGSRVQTTWMEPISFEDAVPFGERASTETQPSGDLRFGL